MKLTYLAYVVIIIVTSCSHSMKKVSEFPVIDIEAELENFKISKLSTYTPSIRYLRLETNDNCLVTNSIRNIYLEDNKIFVHDYEPYLKVFDSTTGKYLYNVGAKGQGPGELPNMYTVDINPNEKNILLCWGRIFHLFDFEGNFLEKKEVPFINNNDNINTPIVSIDKHNFAGTIRTSGNQKDLVILFNDNQEITGNLKCYENPIQPTNISIEVWSQFDQGGVFYRSNQEVRYFRGFTDTLFAYQQEIKMFSPYLIIDYGKYKSTLNFTRGAENPDLIKITSINENNRYIFINFHTENASPEPYEDEIYRNGNMHKFTNYSISGIFDKQNQSFHFLLQSVPGMPGLKNDIDNGIPFFVRNTSSKNQLIDYYHAYKFLEYAESLPQSDDSFKRIINQISEEDNPIVIIAE